MISMGPCENPPDLTAQDDRHGRGDFPKCYPICSRALEVVSDEPTQVEFIQEIGPRGGMADASVLGADVRKDVGVRVSPRPFLVSIGIHLTPARQGGTIGLDEPAPRRPCRDALASVGADLSALPSTRRIPPCCRSSAFVLGT